MINTSLLVLVLFFLFAGFSSEAPSQAPKPNLLLIIADDLRTNLESYGMNVVSPNLTQITTSLLRHNFQIL
ncbi:MAG: hypothetical protein EXS07_07565 [Gemmataceae bacterium]|nr:hypothetical protein [Gemmataceae bacterium]